MKKEIMLQIHEIKKRMKCNKGFQCAQSGFRKLCRAKDVGLRRHLLCQENGSAACDFSLLVEQQYFCACPLRVYLIKNLRKNGTNQAAAL